NILAWTERKIGSGEWLRKLPDLLLVMVPAHHWRRNPNLGPSSLEERVLSPYDLEDLFRDLPGLDARPQWPSVEAEPVKDFGASAPGADPRPSGPLVHAPNTHDLDRIPVSEIRRALEGY